MTDDNDNEENFYECLYCGCTFDSEDERDSHTFQKHMKKVEENLAKIRTIAEEHKQTLEDWQNEKRKELLLKIANEDPRLLHELQGTHGDEILEKMIQEDLFKKALKCQTPSKFELMFLAHPKFAEIQKQVEEEKKPEPETQIPDFTKKTEHEELSEEDRHRKELLIVLTSLMRRKKKE